MTMMMIMTNDYDDNSKYNPETNNDNDDSG